MSAAMSTSRPPSLQERAFHGAPDVQRPGSEAALAHLLRDAHAEGRRLVPGGAGAHAALRDHEEGVTGVVSAEAFNTVVEYKPDDFTVGVGAGVPLAELRKILAKNGQEIPTDWPRLTPGTVGGLVARAPAGVRQGRYGPLHASVLG
ncbi:MAG: FAD-dependent oxidoreductase, partial [Gemmatimonadetes bacterium]|nr:FAD-dependent oxidoreductase [Gemmatimonadota bacterium]